MHENLISMRLSILLLLAFSSIRFSVHSQFFIGAKSSYDQYFDSRMHGVSLGIFSEIPTGEYLNNSFRISIFYGLPIRNTVPDGASLYPINSTSSLPDDIPLPVTSTIKNIGLSVEDLYFFRNDAFTSSFYTIIKFGISSSSITRKADEFDQSTYYLNGSMGNNKQISLYLGLGGGYQYALGLNSILFAEIHFGLPFVGLKSSDEISDSSASGKLTYPLLNLSGCIGFKQSIFN